MMRRKQTSEGPRKRESDPKSEARCRINIVAIGYIEVFSLVSHVTSLQLGVQKQNLGPSVSFLDNDGLGLEALPANGFKSRSTC